MKKLSKYLLLLIVFALAFVLVAQTFGNRALALDPKYIEPAGFDLEIIFGFLEDQQSATGNLINAVESWKSSSWTVWAFPNGDYATTLNKAISKINSVQYNLSVAESSAQSIIDWLDGKNQNGQCPSEQKLQTLFTQLAESLNNAQKYLQEYRSTLLSRSDTKADFEKSTPDASRVLYLPSGDPVYFSDYEYANLQGKLVVTKTINGKEMDFGIRAGTNPDNASHYVQVNLDALNRASHKDTALTMEFELKDMAATVQKADPKKMAELCQPTASCAIIIKKIFIKDGEILLSYCTDTNNDGEEDLCALATPIMDLNDPDLQKYVEDIKSGKYVRFQTLLESKITAKGLNPKKCEFKYSDEFKKAFDKCNFLITEPPEEPPVVAPRPDLPPPPAEKPSLCIATDPNITLDPNLSDADKKIAKEISDILKGRVIEEEERQQCSPEQKKVLDAFINLANSQRVSNEKMIASTKEYFSKINIDPAKILPRDSYQNIIKSTQSRWYFVLWRRYFEFNGEIIKSNGLLDRLQKMRSGASECGGDNIKNYANWFRSNLIELIKIWEGIQTIIPSNQANQDYKNQITAAQNIFRQRIGELEKLVPTIGVSGWATIPIIPTAPKKIGVLYISSDDHKPMFCPPCQTLKGMMGNQKDKDGNSWKLYVNIVNNYPPTGAGIPTLILNNNQSINGSSNIANTIKNAMKK
ncbi:MAG: hypothetical protein ABH822_01170 [Patescibacteria group bacterium]